MSRVRLINFLRLKKVRVPLAIATIAFFLISLILWVADHDLQHRSAGRGFEFLGFFTLVLGSMPHYYTNLIQHHKEASELPFFWVVMSLFLLGFLSIAIFFFVSAV
jgi:hypothetical protein